MPGRPNANSFAGQVGKMLGEKWKALDDKERRPYEEKAAADKKRYEDEKASYNVSTSPAQYPEAGRRAMLTMLAQAGAAASDEESS
ncbi:hypothetical protein P170DRAFT_434572 [Aspergillus steynii IBT 23096]|uniref:HMG box domain-containing protein n=1 Tax=Aspergillus steynii IBT 23096 TaxID=1392250 RepID=A0A2I2GJ38_9EURO|nr:uncharacterized protein P170DRAFT_434572 [Aspergillus steynii IBT 23096]PLB52847.1 hypothetical protein P170DRAFT_434572 [Aspergillus steynii IBT 23096]